MPSTRSVLEQLSREELRSIVKGWGLHTTDLRSRESLIDALTSPTGPTLPEVLRTFQRARLKALCRAVGLDDSGKTIQELIDRLTGQGSGEDTSTEGPEALITSFEIRGFKSIARATVDLGAVNVFIGANGSGKSNLLEALGVLSAAAFRSVEPETLRHRGVRPGLPVLYKTSLDRGPSGVGGTDERGRIRRMITLEIRGASALYRVGLDNPISATREPWGIVSEALSEIIEDHERPILTRSPRGCNVHEAYGSRWQLSPPKAETAAKSALQHVQNGRAAKALVDALIDFAIFSPTTNVLRGLSEDVARQPLGLSGSQLAVAVRDLMDRENERFGPFDLDELWELIEWADDVAAVPAQQASVSPAVPLLGSTVLRFRDRFMRRHRNTLSAYDASEGALYILFLLTLAAHPKGPRIFAVDNFDHALHPRLAARLVRMVVRELLADGRRQMLLTTHNPLVLDGLDLSDDRVRLFAVERREHGETGIQRIELTPELLAQADKGLSLSRLWVMGRLGAVPRNL